MPFLTFSDVEKFSGEVSSRAGIQKAYKFFAEPGYLFNYHVWYGDTEIVVKSKCHRSMKKNEAAHSVKLTIATDLQTITGTCSCVAGAGGGCQHIIALLLLLAHCKQLGLSTLPEELSCTMTAQRWSVPRTKTIQPISVTVVQVKKPREGADYNKSIKSSLYSPATHYLLLSNVEKTKMQDLNPIPLMCTLIPDSVSGFPAVSTKFGNVPKGSVISYQQKLCPSYIINDYANASFPFVPSPDAPTSFSNNLSFCFSSAQQMVKFDSLSLNFELSHLLEEQTRAQGQNQLWHSLRKNRITASKFGLVAKRQSNFESLVKQLSGARHIQTAAMKKGIELEPRAAAVYASKYKRNQVNLFPSGLIIHPECPWLGCTPDRKVFDMAPPAGVSPYGLLEIKVVCKEGITSLDHVPYLTLHPESRQTVLNTKHQYYFQVQCQLALTGLEWCDFFCYVNDQLYFCQKIIFDPVFFQANKDKVDSFYFHYFL